MPQSAEPSLLPDHAEPVSARLCLAIGCLIAIASLALYGPTVGFEFVNYDDPKYASDNPAVQQGLSLENFGYAFTETGMSDWYPVLYLSYMADVTLFGPNNPGAHHGVNAALHTINALLLFMLLVRWTAAPWPSAFAAAMFAIHPLHVESVAWISMRKDVLGTLFVLLALAAYTAYSRRRDSKQTAWPWYLLITALFIAGCMTKANIIMLPAALLLLDAWPLRRLTGQEGQGMRARTARLAIEKLPWCAVSLAIAVVHLQITGETVEDRPDLSLIQSGAIALVSYAGHLVNLFLPTDLACWYPHPAQVDADFMSDSAFSLRLALSTAALGAITAITLWQARRRPYLIVGWLWYLITLLPSSGLVSFASFYLSDRYVYLPFWGIYWMLAWAGWKLLSRRPKDVWVAGSAAGLALIACFVLSLQQVRVWRDSETLMRHAIEHTEDNAFAHNNLGSTLATQGKWEQALSHFQTSLKIDPDNTDTVNNLGTALQQIGQTHKAVSTFQSILKDDPDHVQANYHLGNARLTQERFSEAIDAFERVIELQPDHVEAHNNLGNALQLIGMLPEAVARYEQALEVDPGHAEASYNLANAMVGLQRLDDAISQYQHTLKIDPGYAQAHNNLGSVYQLKSQTGKALHHYGRAVAIDPDFAQAHANRGNALMSVRRFDQAILSYRQAVRLQPDDVISLNALGTAHANLGDFRQAIETVRQALEIAPDALKPALRLRLESYESGRLFQP